MSDIVQEHVHDAKHKQAREAEGEVDGVEIELKKISYSTRRQDTEWKVYVDSDHNYRKQEAGLSAKEADALFFKLVEKYDLTQTT